MFEFAWPWIFLLAPLPWLLRALLPPADSGEAALKVSFLDELQDLSGQRARGNISRRGVMASVRISKRADNSPDACSTSP